jgi:hypothetical protein
MSYNGMINEIPASAAPAHQTIIKVCRFDFAMIYLPNRVGLRQIPSDFLKFYHILNTDRIHESQSRYTSEMKMILCGYKKAFLSVDGASNTLIY